MSLRCIFLLIVFGGFAGAADFRAAAWGMSEPEVRATESGKPAAQADNPRRIIFPVAVAGLRAGAIYEFADGILVQAAYALAEKYNEPNLYVTNGAKWIAGLKAKYGEPETEVRWLNDLYKGQEQKYGFAISAGHLQIINRWRTDRSIIEHSIRGNNFKIQVRILYTSREHEAAANRPSVDQF